MLCAESQMQLVPENGTPRQSKQVETKPDFMTTLSRTAQEPEKDSQEENTQESTKRDYGMVKRAEHF